MLTPNVDLDSGYWTGHLATDPVSGTLYVSNSSNLLHVSSSPSVPPVFSMASSRSMSLVGTLCVDWQGNEYASDFMNARVVKFDSDGNELLAFALNNTSLVVLSVDRLQQLYLASHQVGWADLQIFF